MIERLKSESGFGLFNVVVTIDITMIKWYNKDVITKITMRFERCV